MHRLWLGVSLIALVGMSLGFGKVSEDPLSGFLWENRLIVVQCVASEADKMVQVFEAEAEGIEERHIIWFVIVGGQLRSNAEAAFSDSFADAVREQVFGGQGEALRAALIGKDGA